MDEDNQRFSSFSNNSGSRGSKSRGFYKIRNNDFRSPSPQNNNNSNSRTSSISLDGSNNIHADYDEFSSDDDEYRQFVASKQQQQQKRRESKRTTSPEVSPERTQIKRGRKRIRQEEGQTTPTTTMPIKREGSRRSEEDERKKKRVEIDLIDSDEEEIDTSMEEDDDDDNDDVVFIGEKQKASTKSVSSQKSHFSVKRSASGLHPRFPDTSSRSSQKNLIVQKHAHNPLFLSCSNNVIESSSDEEDDLSLYNSRSNRKLTQGTLYTDEIEEFSSDPDLGLDESMEEEEEEDIRDKEHTRKKQKMINEEEEKREDEEEEEVEWKDTDKKIFEQRRSKKHREDNELRKKLL